MKRLSILALTLGALGAHIGMLPEGTLQQQTALLFGLLSMSSMGACFVLAARWRWVERVTHGLDKGYQLHRWLGIGAVLSMFAHQMLASEGFAFGHALVPAWAASAGEAGELALNTVILAVALSLLKQLPYHLWRYSHHLMGPAFAVAAWHTLFSDSPLPIGSAGWGWMWLVSILGLGAWVHKLLSGQRTRTEYQVSAITPVAGGRAIELTPKQRPLSHGPGQFAFVSFQQAGLKEAHPYTIASHDDRKLRFIVRELGDYTRKLSTLELGTVAYVQGPYGGFVYRPEQRRQLWVAGGVGVTPFLAFLHSLKGDEHPEIDLVLCTRSRQASIGIDEIEALIADKPSIQLHICSSEAGQRLSAKWLQQNIQRPLSEAQVYFCGPQGLRDRLATAMRTLSLSAGRLHYEHFDMRGASLDAEALGRWNRPWFKHLPDAVTQRIDALMRRLKPMNSGA